MPFTIREIADALGAKAFGNEGLLIDGAAEPATAGPGDLALAMKPDYAEHLGQGRARAAVLWDGADWEAMGLLAALVVPRPRYALSGLTRLMDPGPDIAQGIHPSAVIEDGATLGAGACVGPFVTIGRGAQIGPGARIAAHASIGAETRIGADCSIAAGARICARVQIGDRFIAHPGCVIGSDGFSFVTPEKSSTEKAREGLTSDIDHVAQAWTRIHSLGGVVIGDDVEVGANAAIDRGTIRATRIGRGTKIDNLVHIGHNADIGEDCLLCGQVGMAGSVRVGNRVVLGGQVGVSDNIFVGDDVVAGGATKIYSNVPAGRVILGSPAIRLEKQLEAARNIRRLPRLFRDVAALKKAVLNPGDSD